MSRFAKPSFFVHVFTFCLTTCALAQTAPVATGGPAFEVASIKRSPRPEPNPFGFPVGATIRVGPGGLVTATQATLRDLILRAYDLQNSRVTGGPGWMASDRFDVIARPEAGFGGDAAQTQHMLRTLLADRFKLRVHTETREIPVFHLTMARADGRLGSQLRASAIDCAAVRAKRGADDTRAAVGSEPACQPSFRVSNGSMTMLFQGETMSELARRLIPERGRPVLDKTGLVGTFDGELTFAPEPLPGFPRLPGSESGTSVFTALQEQFGLTLQPQRGPVDMLVVNAAEPPTEN